MKKINLLIMLSFGILLVASANLTAQTNKKHHGVQNRFYLRVTALEVFDTPDEMGDIGRFRGTNALNEVYPEYEETWNRKYFRAPLNVPFYTCEWGFNNCIPLFNPWYKLLHLQDQLVIVDAEDYTVDGKRYWHVLVIYIWI